MARPSAVRPSDWQVVATDLDGTLLRPDGTVSEFTRDQLTRVVTSGRRLFFVTGRPPRWMPAVVATTGHDGVAVCANGAVVLDLATEIIVAAHTLPVGDLGDVCEVIRAEMGPDTRFAVEVAPLGPLAGNHLIHEPDFLPGVRIRAVSAPLSELVTTASVVKLLARGTGHVDDTAAVARRVASATGDSVSVTHSSRTHQLLEIAPPGVTKAATLAEQVQRAGASAQTVVAFGDMPNDIPMLSWAGWGVAVSDAHESVIAVADEVVADPQYDGVARWLARSMESDNSE